ncbi:MAG TPA: M28 family peptidase [Terriglobia bacterium]|nr:M28 family peptidase [Terriglobia bacterium]
MSLRGRSFGGICLRSGVAAVALAAFILPWAWAAQGPKPASVPYARIDEAGMREWLTYLSSDQLQGRQVFTEGYGLATAYVADRLKEWGVRPLGDDGTYFQTVRLRGFRVTRNSSVTVEINGQSRTYKHGDHVTFPVNGGGRQTLKFDGFEFIGTGTPARGAPAPDVKGKLAVWMAPAPAGGPGGRGGNRGRGGAGAAIGQGAAAVIGLAAPAAQTAAPQPANAGGAAARGRGRGAAVQPDFTSIQRVDGLATPQFTADNQFFEFLFSSAPTSFPDLKAALDNGEAPAPFAVSGVKITIDIDNTFDVVSQQLTRNVVGLIEGADPALKNTYVMLGAHLDHVGYSQNGAGQGGGNCRQRGAAALAALREAGITPQNAPRGRGGPNAGPAGAPQGPAPAAVPFEQRDLIYNGADDDGSGSTAVLAIAKAFATGPKPKRSVIFIWHAGEESGLYGSRYNADYPVVPLEKVQAVLNIDMVGRDDCNDLEGDYTNTLFVVGADRISTDLHNVIVETNRTFQSPLKLDYELNDAADPENIYTRSDHYSYAVKGVPIAFFTTGLHPDYHRPSDSVEKILFPKMARIAQLIYEVGYSIADSERDVERDNKGPRTGFGSQADVLPR